MNLNKPICIAENKKANMLIIAREYKRAAGILAGYLNKITDAVFQVQDTTTVNPSIVLQPADHGADGFRYRIFDKDIIIEAGNEQACVYAVYDWLERVAGCRYYSRDYEYIPFDANLTVCFEEYAFQPVLEYREILYKDYGVPEFAEKHKMIPCSKRDESWGFWCHSFYTLCPPEEYFDEHPEYFSLYEGRRVGDKAQLCLSNPDVFRIVLGNLKKHMERKPAARYWSVSQNDNDAYCQCDKCREMNERDGSPIGSVLNFVNRVAEHFPDKVISTLAYWYTRKAPAVTRPADNVHIMLCNIEANRGLPIETDERSSGSRQELLDWKEMRCQSAQRDPWYGIPCPQESSADRTASSACCTGTDFCRLWLPEPGQCPGRPPWSWPAHDPPAGIPARSDPVNRIPLFLFPAVRLPCPGGLSPESVPSLLLAFYDLLPTLPPGKIKCKHNPRCVRQIISV